MRAVAESDVLFMSQRACAQLMFELPSAGCERQRCSAAEEDAEQCGEVTETRSFRPVTPALRDGVYC
jgi:hypothetical protein